MSQTLATIRGPKAAGRPGGFSRLLRAWWGEIARYFVRRAAVASLHRLDDRALRDIGLERCQIEAAVRGLIAPSGQGRMR